MPRSREAISSVIDGMIEKSRDRVFEDGVRRLEFQSLECYRIAQAKQDLKGELDDE